MTTAGTSGNSGLRSKDICKSSVSLFSGSQVGRVTLQPFGRLDPSVKRALQDEASRLESFVAG